MRDPQAVLNDLIKYAIAGQDYEAVSDLAYTLVNWHDGGGAVPDLKAALDAAIKRRKAIRGG
jgi:hypothetical protein